MNDVIQHYLRTTYAKIQIDSFMEPRNRFIHIKTETDEKKHEHLLDELKQTQRGFHEYVSVLVKAIDENIEFLNKPFKINIRHNKQIEKIKIALTGIKDDTLGTEQTINHNINVLLDLLPAGNKNNYTLSEEEIKSLKEDNIHQEMMFFLSIFSEPDDAYSIPQEPLFSLIDAFMGMCRITMRLCLIQQQIQDLYFEGDFDPEKRKEILFIKNYINEKMSDIQEKLNSYNMELESISDAQIQFFFDQENNKNSIKRDIEKTKEQTLKGIEQTNKNQKKINENQVKIEKLIHNKKEIDEEKTGTLSVEQCVFLIGTIKHHYVELKQRDCRSIGIPPETIRKVNEKTTRRYVEYWDQYLKGNKKQGRKPPRKDYSRNMSKEDYGRLINDVELDKYNKWRVKNRIVELRSRRTNRFDDK